MENIPQEAWIVFSGLGGAFIGGLITLFVTFIQNLAASNRLKDELKHDKETRSEEREMSLRREIYYGAIDSIANAIKVLSAFGEIDLQNFTQNMPQDLTAKFYRVQLIGGKKVLAAFFKSSNLVSEAIFALMPQKLELQNLEIEKNSNQELQEIAFEAHKGITSKIEEMNNQKEYNEELHSMLMEASDSYMKDINSCIQKGEEISKEIAITKLELIKDSLPWLKKINKASGTVIFSMRKELDSKADNETFALLEELIEKSNQDNEERVNNLISDLNKMIEEG